jgi:hypothetical protein
MRKIMPFCVVLMMVAGVAVAQDRFIPEKDKRERRAEIRRLCEQLLNESEIAKRAQIRKKIVELDVIRDEQGRPKGDGFAAEPLGWLYTEARNNRPDLNARLQAVLALGALESSSANEHIVKALDDPSPAIQLLAIYTAERGRLQAAAPKLKALLTAANADVKSAAAAALATLGADGDTARAIVRQMKDALAKLKTETDESKRQQYQRVIEVMGRSVARLVEGVQWMPGPTVEEVEKAIEQVDRAVNP